MTSRHRPPASLPRNTAAPQPNSGRGIQQFERARVLETSVNQGEGR
jgi:hypothetical protein